MHLKKINKIKLNIFVVMALVMCFSKVYGYDSSARSAILKDVLTDTVIIKKNASIKIPPASMSKLMTLIMIFEGLKNDRINLDDKFRVSKKASSKGGSKMFLREGELVSIENLIKGIIVHSGNDACIVVAEGLSGTEESFAKDMNDFAKKIGIKDSFFTNSTGWPDKRHVMSSRDLLFLTEYILNNYPNYYFYFSQLEFTWDGITQKNRNPLLNKGLGADGLKTGHTKEAGYGLTGSAKRGNRRIIFVLSGMDTKKERTREAEKVVSWAFRNFESIKIYDKNTPIASLPVWLGEKEKIKLSLKDDVHILQKIDDSSKFVTKIIYESDIEAPVKKGDPTNARLIITTSSLDYSNSFINKEFDLYAYEDIEKGGIFEELKSASVKILIFIFKILKIKS